MKEKVSPEITKEEIMKLKLVQNISPKQIQEILSQSHMTNKKEINKIIWNTWELLLWVLSDTHLNNKQCDVDSLHQFYEDADKEWVDAFVHAWDLTDWINVYKGQIYELLNLSFDDQLRYVAENYPKVEWKDTYFISWNHDESRLKQWWINFWDAISRERPDMKHLGFYNAKLKLNDFDIEMQHWWGSSPYAASYHLQRYMERIPQEEHIDLRILGHYHRELSMLYRWALAMLPWAFLKENLLAKRFKLGNNITWSVVKLKKNEDGKLEFLPHMFKYK